MINSDELQMKVQRSLQEYDDAVEGLDPRFAELGRASVAALEEFIDYWERHRETHHAGDAGADEPEGEMQEFVERQLEWARSEKQRVLDQLSKR